MKIKGLYIGIVAAVAMSFAVATATFRADAQAPGIAMVGSQNYSSLPKDARHFIEKHFKGVGVTSCERYYAKGKYEVELSNGVDIEFNDKGKVIEIDAPSGALLPVALVKDLLPGKAFKRLQDAGIAARVESIEFDKRGKAVEVELSIPEPDTYIFDINGEFIAIQD